MGHRRQALPRLPVGVGRHGARARAPGRRRGAGHTGAHPVARVEPVRQRRGPRGGRDARPPRGRRGRARRRAGVLHQLRGRGQRVRPQAGSQVGGARAPRRGEHVGRVPRADPGHAARHGPTREARPVRPSARGLRARRLRRSRRPRRGVRPGSGRRGAPRAHPGRIGGHRPVFRLPRGRAGDVHRARHPAHGGRDPDGTGTDGPVVRVPAHRDRARRGHHGQGARQRRAHRRLLGPGRGGGGLLARRPRQHLRRTAPGGGGGAGHAGGDGGRGRARPGAPGRRPPAGRPGGARRGGRRAWRRAPAGGGARRPAGQGGGRRGPRPWPRGERAPARHHPVGAVAVGERRRGRRGPGACWPTPWPTCAAPPRAKPRS